MKQPTDTPTNTKKPMNIELTDQQKIKIINSEDVYAIMQKVLLREEIIDQE
ncbi:MAG: hypothetical protein COB30_007070, partial [Ectothiorhodospiraceae bacterium]|nr:hypothetical protein [Ectothiorhodospiraceae bacterium]